MGDEIALTEMMLKAKLAQVGDDECLAGGGDDFPCGSAGVTSALFLVVGLRFPTAFIGNLLDCFW